MRVDQQLVVVAEQGVVERGVVQPHLAALFGHQRPVIRQGRAYLRGQGVADAFLVPADGNSLPCGIAEAKPDEDIAGCPLSEHPGDVRVGLGEESSREDKHVDPLTCFLQQAQPRLARDTGPVGVGADQFAG